MDEMHELRAALYGSDIVAGDIPQLKMTQAENVKRLTRLEWAVIVLVVATGADGVGAIVGRLAG